MPSAPGIRWEPAEGWDVRSQAPRGSRRFSAQAQDTFLDKLLGEGGLEPAGGIVATRRTARRGDPVSPDPFLRLNAAASRDEAFVAFVRHASGAITFHTPR